MTSLSEGGSPPELLPCPFCRNAATLVWNESGSCWIECSWCRVQTTRYRDESAVTAVWNDRYVEEQGVRLSSSSEETATTIKAGPTPRCPDGDSKPPVRELSPPAFGYPSAEILKAAGDFGHRNRGCNERWIAQRAVEVAFAMAAAAPTPNEVSTEVSVSSSGDLLRHPREGYPSERVPIPATAKQLRGAMAHIEHNTPAATEWTDIQVMLEAVARWVESDGRYPRKAPPPVTVERCPSHHYVSGWCCQLPANHTGPCLANAGINGEEWQLGAGRRAVYAWHRPPGQPACNQRPCENPNKCGCVDGLSPHQEKETP